MGLRRTKATKQISESMRELFTLHEKYRRAAIATRGLAKVIRRVRQQEIAQSTDRSGGSKKPKGR